jgi:hypothetical protein
MLDKDKYESIINECIGSSKIKSKVEIETKVDKKVWFRDRLDRFFILCNENRKYIYNTILGFGCILIFFLGYFFTIKILTPNSCLDEDICQIEELLTAEYSYGNPGYSVRTNESYANFLYYVEKGNENDILVYTKDGTRLLVDSKNIMIKNNGKKTLFYDTDKRIWILNF